ncbi:MAG TPA: segregation/condensation protein A, partial [Acidimicrobiia bacterium]|nr:segregation/condensation protein A [Acidimicrobiia bacterium]
MTFHVRTAVFEGPLDLLLQLITRRQVEITAVGLTEVVWEYLGHIEEMRELDIDLASEFLLIAATLIKLKTQALLPSGGELDLDDELALAAERDRLLSRLLASVTFKDVAAVLRSRLQEGNRFVPRVSGLDQKIHRPLPPIVIPATPDELLAIANKVFARAAVEPDLDHLDLDLPSVGVAMEDLQERLRLARVASFDDLTDHCRGPVEVA